MVFVLLSKYKKVISFITIFSLVYLVFALGYNLYISNINDTYFPDIATYNVSWLTKSILQFFSNGVNIEPDQVIKSQKLYLNNNLVFNIVEGCNGISVIMLFVAFVVSLKGSFLKTTTYLIFGGLCVYVANVMRLVLLALGYNYYPLHKVLMHDVLFPLFIYGVLLLLWLFWIKINVKNL